MNYQWQTRAALPVFFIPHDAAFYVKRTLKNWLARWILEFYLVLYPKFLCTSFCKIKGILHTRFIIAQNESRHFSIFMQWDLFFYWKASIYKNSSYPVKIQKVFLYWEYNCCFNNWKRTYKCCAVNVNIMFILMSSRKLKEKSAYHNICQL